VPPENSLQSLQALLRAVGQHLLTELKRLRLFLATSVILLTFELLVHQTLAPVGLDMLYICHVHKRGDDLSFFECGCVDDVGDLDLVLAHALNLDICLVIKRHEVPFHRVHEAEGLLAIQSYFIVHVAVFVKGAFTVRYFSLWLCMKLLMWLRMWLWIYEGLMSRDWHWLAVFVATRAGVRWVHREVGSVVSIPLTVVIVFRSHWLPLAHLDNRGSRLSVRQRWLGQGCCEFSANFLTDFRPMGFLWTLLE